MKTSLLRDCIIIRILEKRLEGLGSYKNVLKIQEKKGGRAPLGPSPKSAYILNALDSYQNTLLSCQVLDRYEITASSPR